ncbi:MAG: F0F1 ATP synthase subunit B [Armatimonadota bacterium]|nr:F0F1 ATP synthase subunit B [bacterium]
MQIIPDPKVLLVQAIGFLLVLLVFKFFLFKPIMDILDARRAEIDNQYDTAESQRSLAEDLKAQYEKHLAEIDDEMRAKIAEAVKEGQSMREEIITDSREQADRILTRAQDEIQREKEKALVDLRSTVASLTIGAAGKLINENLDDAKHRELIGKYIDDLDEVTK